MVVYTFLYALVHESYLFPHFDYAGFKTHEYSLTDVCTTTLFIVIPVIYRPRISSYLYLDVLFTFIYFLLYVPIEITAMYHLEDFLPRVLYQLTFFCSLLIMFSAAYFKSVYFKILETRGFKHFYFVWILFVVVGGLFILNRDSYAFVSFDDVYFQRKVGKSSSLIEGYLVMWLTYTVGPYIIVKVLLSYKLYLSFLGVAAILFVYGINASKIALFIPGVVILTYIIWRQGRDIFISYGNVFIFLMSISLLLKDILGMIAAIVLMRTFSIGGLLTDQYFEFFSSNELTYYSHINFIQALGVEYPYDRELGYVVSSGFFESDNNANANFWATDGLAALGLVGVPIISFVMALFLWIIKGLLNRRTEVFIGLMFVPFSFILLNVGLFTSLLSGGFLFYFCLLFIFRFRFESTSSN